MGDAHADFVLRFFEILHRNRFVVVPCRGERRFVAKIGEVRAPHPNRAACKNSKIYLRVEAQLFGVAA
jgi:hypothetical protein